jgi:hypothetical protein
MTVTFDLLLLPLHKRGRERFDMGSLFVSSVQE